MEEITIDDLKKGKHTYRIKFSYTEGCSVIVNAESEEEAEEKLQAYLEWYGNDETLRKEAGFNCSNREWDTYGKVG